MSKKKTEEELQKANNEEEVEEEEKEEGEDMEKMKKCGAKKSEDLTEDDLEKSLEKLESMITGEDSVSRKDTLLEKAQSEELSEDERAELFGLLGNQEQADDAHLSDEVSKGLTENPDIQKALDVSDFLQEQNTELVKALGTVAQSVDNDSARQHEFNLVLAKAISDIGKHVKGVSERLGMIEEQPAHKPKSKGIRSLEKSFAGQTQTAGSEAFQKSQVLDALEEMTVESMQKGRNGLTEDGLDLTIESSKYEQFNMLSPSVLQLVKAHIEQKKAAAH